MPLHLGCAPLFRVIPGGNQKLHVIEAGWPGVFLGSPVCFVDTASHFLITKFLAADVSTQQAAHLLVHFILHRLLGSVWCHLLTLSVTKQVTGNRQPCKNRAGKGQR